MVDMGVKTVRVQILGRVQGVWYRAWTTEQATRRKLDGWVRNLKDGSVEALFSGEEKDVDAMIDTCWQGPTHARVEDVLVSEENTIVETGFKQRPTS